MPPQKIVIRKYENRRLYDTAASRYVNLEDVAQMVRDGTEIQVVDASTGEDLTRLILTQIIVENAKGGDSSFPLDILRQMVMTSGAHSQEALLKYMRTTMEMYQNAYRAFSPAATPLDFMKNIMGSGWTPGSGWMATPHSQPSPQPPPEPQAAPHPPAETPSEVNELRHRVEELEKLFSASASAEKKAKKTKKKR
jgi:polyhydroxyalkanoate synthesis repressor PhaR